MDGIAGVQARIQDILSQFNGPPVAASDTSASTTDGSASAASGSSAGTSDFAAALAQAQSSAGAPSVGSRPRPARSTAPAWTRCSGPRTSSASSNMPVTAENVRAITAWEQAEGTKASYNPLATTQGGFTGETTFNSVGVKNYASYQDGLDANVKVITNGLYGNILSALQQGNDADAVARAVANSPWGTGTGVERVLASQS